jgi:redox-sensing transcriptional repressor
MPARHRHLIRGGSLRGAAPEPYRGLRKIATLFQRSQAANVNAWPDNGAQPQTRFASARSERKPPVTVHQHGRYGTSVDDLASRAVPDAAVGRLAVYLRVLTSMIEQGVTTMSSEELAGAAGVNSATLRKDLSYVGSYGTRGVGYDTARLVEHIERLLGLTRHHSVAVVGIGNLGHALANYGGFPDRGFPVTALFDLEADLIGVPVGGLPVDHVDSIPAVCAEREVTIGVICTPAAAAQWVCDLLVAGGVRCILNFAPVVLQVPDDVEVRRVDLAVELQILSFYQARRSSRRGPLAEPSDPIAVGR